MLERGANPNVFLEDGDTVLASVEFDVEYHTFEAGDNWWSTPDKRLLHAEDARRLTEVVAILRRYGAKRPEELRAEECDLGSWRRGPVTKIFI